MQASTSSSTVVDCSNNMDSIASSLVCFFSLLPFLPLGRCYMELHVKGDEERKERGKQLWGARSENEISQSTDAAARVRVSTNWLSFGCWLLKIFSSFAIYVVLQLYCSTVVRTPSFIEQSTFLLLRISLDFVDSCKTKSRLQQDYTESALNITVVVYHRQKGDAGILAPDASQTHRLWQKTLTGGRLREPFDPNAVSQNKASVRNATDRKPQFIIKYCWSMPQHLEACKQKMHDSLYFVTAGGRRF